MVTSHKHHYKHIAKHHTAKKPVPRVDETINIDDYSATAIVNIKDGDVYYNDSLIAHVKNPKNEGHRIIINYIAPQPQVTVIEHARTNTYTGEMPAKGMLGVQVFDDCMPGARINRVIPTSPADKIGLEPGDMITKINDRQINNSDELLEVLGSYHAGDDVTVTVKDWDGTKTTRVALSKEFGGCSFHSYYEPSCSACRSGRR
jgi:S1-C subfamily serine protease